MPRQKGALTELNEQLDHNSDDGSNLLSERKTECTIACNAIVISELASREEVLPREDGVEVES